MAINLPTGGATPNHEPNVVPMIDILLVLLIIFMMQVPMSRKAQDVQVPPDIRNPNQPPSGPSNNIVLELTADGGYMINKDPVDQRLLDAKFHEIYDNRPTKILFVKSAPMRKYQEVVDVIDIARGAGVQVIGFTPPDEAPSEGS
ncbi:MAG: biopolymer transporter ExbD [Gemmatimonadales bacterium]|jgi:biopolymer transport protein ExbD|nr:biopolymer transporter ExbD [Gemmatimonadales bacterium]